MSKFPNFAETHCHQASLDTASTIDSFVDRELELETGVLTCTDHGYMGACMDVYQAAQKNGLKPILGIECYHRSDDDLILKRHGIQNIKEYYKYGHFLAQAKDQEAYECLVKKISVRDLTAEKHGSERKPIFTWEDIEELGAKNIILSSGCLGGVVGKHLLADKPEIAIEYYQKMRSLAKPGNFYVEIFPHVCDKHWESGIFLTLADGRKLKYYIGKTVRTEEFGEIKVGELAKSFSKNKKPGKLLAVKERHVWELQESPSEILNCELIQDYIAEECRPWASNGDLQLGMNKFMLKMAKMHGDKIIIAGDSHYSHKEDHILQDAKLGGMGDSFRFVPGYHRKSSDEAWEYFSTHMGMSERDFEELLDGNKEWVSQFKDFKLEYKPTLPTSFYPKDTLGHLNSLIAKHGRMNWNDQAMKERLGAEIELLHRNGTLDLLPYFFVGEEMVQQYIDRKELTGLGRGSAGGLLSCFLLGITHINPLEYGLSKDRFMTLDRVQSGDLPDIDFDLPHRDFLFGENGWLNKRFRGHWAPISTNSLLRLKMGIKDVARAKFGEVPYEIEALCKTIPGTPQGIQDKDFLFGYVSDDGKETKGLYEEHKGLQAFSKKYPEMWDTIIRLLGIQRQKSKHAAGVIICERPVDSFIPMMTITDERVTQYTASGCEAAGAIKVDFLVLNSLKDIGNALKLIQKRQGIDTDKECIIDGIKVPGFQIFKHSGKNVNIYNPPNDQEVYASICAGQTETVFQLGTASAQKWLKEFDYDKNENEKLISSIIDIATFTALDRPGPLDAFVENENGRKRNMLQEYAARLRGEKPIGSIEYLDKMLPETKGVLCFQEQLSLVFKDLTGCTGAKAEKFRKMIGKKKMEQVLQEYPNFIEKASAKIGKDDAEKVWSQVYTFGQYGFNYSHAVEYGKTAYICAFLKYHYPLEWWCAVLQNADKNEVAEDFWKYCYHYVDLPDISKSETNFAIQNGRIRAPLSLLQGVGEGARKEIEANSPYSNIEDFCSKIALEKIKKAVANPETGKVRSGMSALNSGVVNRLIVTGVMDSLFPLNLNLQEKLEMYQRELAIALKKKKPEAVDEKYLNLTPLQIYQYKKAILAVYSEDLLPTLHRMEIDGVRQKTIKFSEDNQQTFYSYLSQSPKTIGHIMESMELDSMLKVSTPFVDAELFRQLNKEATLFDEKCLRIAVAAYVNEQRPFSYVDKQSGNRVEACAFNLDINGEFFEGVKWPTREGRKLVVPKTNMENGVVVAILSKRKELSPFVIDAIIPIQYPLEDKKDAK